jgi:hypothetical protein
MAVHDNQTHRGSVMKASRSRTAFAPANSTVVNDRVDPLNDRVDT